MILESIVTTIAADGQINLAPMGPVVTHPEAMSRIPADDESERESEDPGFILRPFDGSRTLRNLLKSRRATIHVTDDVSLFAQGAMGPVADVDSLTQRSPCGEHAMLRHCHRWFQVEVVSVQQTPPRYEMPCRVIQSAVVAPFFGFNRAKHAVIEAAILATRTHLIPAAEVHGQLEALRPLVEKTAGTEERQAFETLCQQIRRRVRQSKVSGI